MGASRQVLAYVPGCCSVSPAADVSLTAVTKPSPVGSLKVTATASSVTLKWRNPKPGSFTGVLIRRNPGKNAPISVKGGTLIGNVAAPGATITDRSVKPSTTYSYALFAHNRNSYAKPATISIRTTAKDLAGVNILSAWQYGFSLPEAITADGTHVWVVNSAGGSTGSVTEISEATGVLIRILSAPRYGFDMPVAIASSRADVWVANGYGVNAPGGSVTEINEATGALVRVISGAKYDFYDPGGITTYGADVWVTNVYGNSVTEINGMTGALVQVLRGPSYAFSNPTGITADRTHVWIVNTDLEDSGTDASVTEIDTSTGALVQVLVPSGYGLPRPGAIASDGKHVWVAYGFGGDPNQACGGNFGGSLGSVDEIDASTGALIQVLGGCDYGFGHPSSITSDGTDVWAVNLIVATDDLLGGSVSEIDASTGSPVRVIYGKKYDFETPMQLGIAADGTHVWVGDDPSWVTEFPAS